MSALIPLMILRLSVDLRPYFRPLLVFHRNKLTGTQRFSELLLEELVGFVDGRYLPFI